MPNAETNDRFYRGEYCRPWIVSVRTVRGTLRATVGIPTDAECRTETEAIAHARSVWPELNTPDHMWTAETRY